VRHQEKTTIFIRDSLFSYENWFKRLFNNFAV